MTTQDAAAAAAASAPDPGRTVAEGVLDLATARWRWSPELWDLLGFVDDGRDPEVLAADRMHPDDRGRVAAVLRAAAAAPGPFSGQARVRDDLGRERTIAFVGDADRSSPVIARADDDPGILRLLAFDVSDAVRLASREAVLAATADRAAIEQLKGAIMYAHGLDAEAAFGVLCQLSQRRNIRLSVLARRAADLLAERVAAGRTPSVVAVLDAAAPEAGRAGGRASDRT